MRSTERNSEQHLPAAADFAVIAFAMVAVVVMAFATAPLRARADVLDDEEPPDPVTRLERAGALGLHGPASPDEVQRILDQVPDPTPTPFPDTVVLEVTEQGNVVLPIAPMMLVIRGQCPPELVPPRCREEFVSLPAGAALVCMRTREIHDRLYPGGTH